MGRVFIVDQAQKEFLKLPSSEQLKIKKRLTILESDFFAGKKLVGKLKGLYSLKVWPYRIIYLLKNHSQEIWIVHILHRQGAYK